jgi:hypothetical protein
MPIKHLRALYRTIRRTTRAHSELKSHFQPSIRSSHQKFASRQKSTIRTSMRRARFVCPSFRPRTGSQLRKQIKVTHIFTFVALCSYFSIYLSLSLSAVIQALVALVNDPEPEHPLRAELAEEYLKDRKKFMKNAEEFTRKHSEKRHD